MNTKLDNITTQYRKFNANQALTEGQLNEFIDYFEDQDRLSRTRLSGVGIACGFKTALYPVGATAEAQDFSAITVTQGVGITTDGELITLRNKIEGSKEVTINLPSKKYTHFRSFTDRYSYPHFHSKKPPIKGQIPIAELIAEEEYTALVKAGADLTAFTSVTGISGMDDKVVLLYLETYSNEDQPCEEADCDNNGAEQVADLKVLLVTRSDAERYIVNGDNTDAIYNLHDSYEQLYGRLKDIEVPRVILSTDINMPELLKSKFAEVISNEPLVTGLKEGFRAIAQTFSINLDFKGQSFDNKMAELLNIRVDDYQYRYDLLKDLVDTYNEIKGLVLRLKAACCPDIVSFPKHLLLGLVGAQLNLGDYNTLRHDFYNSPINTDADENKERLLLLANRFVQKLSNFRPFRGAIKITPSKLSVILGDKAVPFYYDVNQSLLKKWNFEKTETGNETYNLSYHTSNLANVDFVQRPLLYNIDDNDFYRIEGHLGMPYKIALQNINDLKSAYGLAFDVVPLALQKATASANTTETFAELPTLSVDQLRNNLVSISRDVSNNVLNTRETLRTISLLDDQLKLLNKVEFAGTGSGVSLVKQNPKEKEIVAELLSSFLERNSGLEHLSGVPKGGTFYLICNSENDNEVIADFAAPYLCCSKKDPVFLVLPATQLCEKDAPVPFTILPVDGEIKAFSGNNPVSAITKSGGQSFFNPALVSSQYFNQKITFTVNDDPVDTTMYVYPQPNVSVTTGAIVYGEDQQNPWASVTFNIAGNLTDLSFKWDFDDNTVQQEQNATAVVTHIYQLVEEVQDVFRPKLTVKNKNGCTTEYVLDPVTLKLVINKNTKIQIYFDSSGSMDTTLLPLQQMKSTLLKNRLLPLYGNDSAAYDTNVKVISNTSERTFSFLNIEGSVPPEGNVIVLVFQDEAYPVYQGAGTITNPTNDFKTDITALKARIANNFGTGNSNYYRGVVFQVVGDTTFRSLMEAVETGGHPSYPQGYNLSNEVLEDKVIFKYGVTGGGAPGYYLDLIVEALSDLGYNIP